MVTREDTVNQCSAPQTARTLLQERIATLVHDLNHLQALYQALPLELPADADEALKDLLLRSY